MNMISQTPETLNLKPGTLNLVLVRTRTIGEYTHGSLSIDGTKICSTLQTGKDYWIHVSCRKNRKKNRHQVIRYLKK